MENKVDKWLRDKNLNPDRLIKSDNGLQGYSLEFLIINAIKDLKYATTKENISETRGYYGC